MEIDDDAAADAQLRLTTYDEPVQAVLSVWTDADPGAVTEALQRRTQRLAGWIVEERRTVPPPRDVPDTRADAGLRRRMDRMLESVAAFGGHQDLDVVPTSRYAFDLG